MSEEWIEKRRKAIAEYLDAVLALPMISHTWAFIRFFSFAADPAPEDFDEYDRSGLLSLKTPQMVKWRPCFCVLKGWHLFALKSGDDPEPWLVLNLKRYVVTTAPSKIATNYFVLKPPAPSPTFFVAADSPDALHQWRKALPKADASQLASTSSPAAKRKSKRRVPEAVAGKRKGSEGSGGSGEYSASSWGHRKGRGVNNAALASTRSSGSASSSEAPPRSGSGSRRRTGSKARTRTASGAGGLELIQYQVFVRKEAEAETIAKLTAGGIFTKFGKAGNPKKRNVWCSANLDRIQWADEGKWTSRSGASISVADITGVVPGHSTAVWDKHIARKAESVPPEELCLSIIGHERTLDLAAESEEVRDEWVAAFRFLVGKYEFGVDDLNMREQRLQSMPYEVQLYRKGLTTLDLKSNSIRVLKPSLVSGLTALTYLNVSHNLLGHLPPEIKQLKNLKTLIACHNLLVTLPAEIRSLASLTQLDVAHNFIVALPPDIGSLSRLVKIDLSMNLLSDLPDGKGVLGKLVLLERLNLHGNCLTSLPESVSRLQNLNSLDLSCNSLSTMPECLTGLTQLAELSFGDNPLSSAGRSSLKERIAALSGLTTLGINGLGLGPGSEDLGSKVWSRLEKVDLSANGLTELSKGLKSASHLEELYIQGNSLSSLPKELTGAKSLEVLDLSANAFSKFPADVCRLSKLRVLDVSGNSLSELPNYIVKLTSLETLAIQHTNVRNLPAPLGTLTSISSITLDASDMTYPPKSISEQGVGVIMSYLKDTAEVVRMEDAWRLMDDQLL